MARKMKDSGIEWIGEIPEGWEIKYFVQLFSQVKNKNIGLREKNLLSLSYGKIKQKSIETVGGLLPDNFEGYNIIDRNDIVLRLTDLQNDQHSLRVGLSPERGIITSAYCSIRIRGAESPNYLYYYLHTFDIAKGFYGMGSGVRQGLNWDGLKYIKILLPPQHEQDRISVFLNQKTLEIDSMLSKTISSIEEYKKLKQAVITQAVTKGVRGEREMKDSGVEWIGEIPVNWTIQRFARVAEVKSNLVSPDNYLEYPQISPENIEKDSGKLLLPCRTVAEVGVISGNHLFYKGQILYSKIRPKLNKVCIAPFDGLCSADMYPIESKNDTRYIMYCILSNGFLQQVSMITENRVKMPKINQVELSKVLVAIPETIAEQKEIADYLDAKCTEIDGLIAKKEQLVKELEGYKKSLIYEVVTGKREIFTDITRKFPNI